MTMAALSANKLFFLSRIEVIISSTTHVIVLDSNDKNQCDITLSY